MKFSDIEETHFQHLINYCRSIQDNIEDMKGFHNVDISTEASLVFPSESEIQTKRRLNDNLTEKEWSCYREIIARAEENIAKDKVKNLRRERELQLLNIEHPIKFDNDGYAYRDFVDWDGRPYRSYEKY